MPISLPQALTKPFSTSMQALRLARTSFGPLTSIRSFVTVNAADLRFGQPLHETHPHILRPGECMCCNSLHECALMCSSNSWHYRCRVCPTAVEACREPPEELISNCCCRKYPIPVQQHFLRVSPELRLLLPDRSVPSQITLESYQFIAGRIQ